MVLWFGLIPQAKYPITKEEYNQITNIMREWMRCEDEWNVAFGGESGEIFAENSREGVFEGIGLLVCLTYKGLIAKL